MAIRPSPWVGGTSFRIFLPLANLNLKRQKRGDMGVPTILREERGSGKSSRGGKGKRGGAGCHS